MPLLTKSDPFRQQVLARNLYSLKDSYSLRSDVITKTLDVFQSAGFDLRTSELLSGVERLVDNSALSLIGAKRLVIELGRRVLHNTFKNQVGSINVDNIFSSDPSKTILTKAADFSITPHEAPVTLFDYVSEGFSGEAGKTSALDVPLGKTPDDPELRPGGFRFYEHLGDGQKGILHKQLARNLYSRYPNGQSGYKGLEGAEGGYTVHKDMYSPQYFLKHVGDAYGSFTMDRNGNKTLNSTDKIVNDLEDSVMDPIERMKTLPDVEGFGRTATRIIDNSSLNDANRFLQYHDGTLEQDPALKNERGLLYYTQKLARMKNKIGLNLRSDTINYGEGETLPVVFRGNNECVSYTIVNPYDTYGEAFRFEGNGNKNSVIGTSVMPRIYPTKTKENTLMFSIENLAWDSADLRGIPELEHGPNGGRMMWFPPYGISISESSKPNYDANSFLGRIEDIHTYNKMERAMQLSFMLVVDHPPHVNDHEKNGMGDYFFGCNPRERVAPLDNLPPKLIPTKPPVISIEERPEPFSGKLPVYFYQNDEFGILYNYEIQKTDGTPGRDRQNLFGLNENFAQQMSTFAAYINNQHTRNRRLTINIEASSSALFKNLYNVRLSFKRASILMRYVIQVVNENHQKNLTIPSAPVETNYDKIINKIEQINDTLTYKTNDGMIIFKIVGKGEEYTGGVGSRESEIDLEPVKRLRKARITKIQSQSLAITAPALIPPKTSADALARSQSQADRDLEGTVKGDDVEYGFKSEYTKDTRMPYGFDKLDYYVPVFHAQTPYDLHKRKIFLEQCTRPGDTKEKINEVGSNSLFGRMPICVLRIGDYIHSKVVVQGINFDLSESTWDMNPEGMGVQPMFMKVTMDLTVIGAMSLEKPINRLQTATDFNLQANSTFHNPKHYPQSRWDYKRTTK